MAAGRRSEDRVGGGFLRRCGALAFSGALAAAGLVGAVGDAHAVPGDIERVSVSTAGVEANAHSAAASVSGDGRLVAFTSRASTLVPGDSNDAYDVFVHDRATGQTSRVSVSSAGAQADHDSGSSDMAVDGQSMAFASDASNLAGHDTNDATDVFVHDLASGETRRVSVSSSGAQGNGHSSSPSISMNGRYVSFTSVASNLVAHDTNDAADVFVHDTVTGETRRVSVSSSGAQANGHSSSPSVSGDGRMIAFRSRASNLVAHDTGPADVFVHDLASGETRRVSVSSSGAQANGHSSSPSISGDGRLVAFESTASNLVPGDTVDPETEYRDVFVHDLASGQTSRVNVSSSGEEANGATDGGSPAITWHGRLVAFESDASNLVPGDTNGAPDVFVHDRATGQTSRVSVSSSGTQGDLGSSGPSVSQDGRFVAFGSGAASLVLGDTNASGDVFVAEPRWNTGDCTIIGTSGDNVMLGTPGDDVICGWGGDDLIRALGGRDRVYGGAGNDVIYGGAGADVLLGKRGRDHIFGGVGDDVIYGGALADHLNGQAGSDRVVGELGPDTIIGGIGRDVLIGNAKNDTFFARDSWRDRIFGGPGTDRARVDRAMDVMFSIERRF